jgi:hypothetical protein
LAYTPYVRASIPFFSHGDLLHWRGVNMSKYVLASVFFLLAEVAGAQARASTTAADKPGQENTSRVIVPGLKLSGIVPSVFATLVTEAGLSGGVAISNQDCSHGPEISISVPTGTSFEEALRQVANGKARSEGRLRDGVANLLPTGAEPPLLWVRISNFEWDRTMPVREVIARLRQLPEVWEEALRLGLKEAPIEGGMSAICIRGDCSEKPKPKPVPMLEAEEGATLLTVLNRVVQAHSGSVWSYSEYRCGTDTLFSVEVLAE